MTELREYWLDGDGYERAVSFAHRLKQVPGTLRAFVHAARLMRGGSGDVVRQATTRDTSAWWRGVPVTLGVPRGERRGRVFKTMGVAYASCIGYANELHGEIEAR